VGTCGHANDGSTCHRFDQEVRRRAGARRHRLRDPEGTIFGLLGPNGAGKTTAVRILAAVHRPDAGTEVLGYDVVKDPHEVRMHIGLAGQYAYRRAI